ncbi:MAG: ATP cone domain-containing protein [Candidatus Norongarragalinales archaeon]
MVLVKKKSGEKERFAPSKIARSIVKAGGTVELAGEIADVVADKIKSSGRKLLASSTIRSIVVSLLKKKKPSVAVNYTSFKK